MASLPAFSKEQIDRLEQLNKQLHLDKKTGISPVYLNKIVFVYTPAKVGSTSLVSSLRLFANESLFVCHLHDETKFGSLQEYGVSVMDLVHYNRWLGREVYLVDIYRTPVERKMSDFFENLGSLHFNNTEANLLNVSIDKLRRRFHQVFPHIANEDYFRGERFGIPVHLLPDHFDNEKQYLFVDAINTTGIRYIKLRLQDSEQWGNFLPKLLGIHDITSFHICKDYETHKKVNIGNLYEKFKREYRLPEILFSFLESSDSLSYYCSKEERDTYLQNWRQKVIESTPSNPVTPTPFTPDQFIFYYEILRENKLNYNDIQQRNHYLDNGCSCSLCHSKRLELRERRKYGATLTHRDQIVHEQVQQEANEKFTKAAQRRLEAAAAKKRTATARWSLAANRDSSSSSSSSIMKEQKSHAVPRAPAVPRCPPPPPQKDSSCKPTYHPQP